MQSPAAVQKRGAGFHADDGVEKARSIWKLFSTSYDLFLLLFFLAPEIGADVIPLLVAQFSENKGQLNWDPAKCNTQMAEKASEQGAEMRGFCLGFEKRN